MLTMSWQMTHIITILPLPLPFHWISTLVTRTKQAKIANGMIYWLQAHFEGLQHSVHLPFTLKHCICSPCMKLAFNSPLLMFCSLSTNPFLFQALILQQNVMPNVLFLMQSRVSIITDGLFNRHEYVWVLNGLLSIMFFLQTIQA